MNFYNKDCMIDMVNFKDNEFDLAIVDPPYGMGDKFKSGVNSKMNFKSIPQKGWDVVPNKIYFDELIRVSKNQIIWGGNYFILPQCRGFIVWDKMISLDFSLAMCEYAWSSFDKVAKIYRLNNEKLTRIHPTQKPIKLYRWLLQNYAKPNDTILDTHVGSGSSIIACLEEGFDITGYEIDKDYYDAATKRIEIYQAQTKLDLEPMGG